jgi:hypothetical protein
MNDQATNAPPIDEQLCEEAKTEFARLNEEYQHACIGRGEGAKDDVVFFKMWTINKLAELTVDMRRFAELVTGSFATFGEQVRQLNESLMATGEHLKQQEQHVRQSNELFATMRENMEQAEKVMMEAQELNIRKFKDLDEFQEATTKALTDIVEVLNNR